MNYSLLIENRRSVREFTDRHICPCALTGIKDFYNDSCRRLDSSITTALLVFGADVKQRLEGTAGYENFLIGAPNYLVLLSEKTPLSGMNAGYMMQDISLKLQEMELGSCWITFTDSEAVKQALSIDSRLDVAAILAFGHGKPARRRPRINILSMSHVDIAAKRRYMDPKRGIQDLVFLEEWGNTYKVGDYMGFFDDMLWESFYAVSLSPSYLNRQAYGFLIQDGRIILVERPDSYNNRLDGDLSLGIALLHFDAVAEKWAGAIRWNFAPKGVKLPEGYRAIAACAL
jgi:hypothetical protein